MENFSVKEDKGESQIRFGEEVAAALDGMYEFPLDNSYSSNIHRIFSDSTKDNLDSNLDAQLMIGLSRLS